MELDRFWPGFFFGVAGMVVLCTFCLGLYWLV